MPSSTLHAPLNRPISEAVLAMRHIKHIHFIGIGGAGMGGIAEVLLNQGYEISGSDLQPSAMTERLASCGATIYIGHAASHVDNANVVVASTAVPADNVEVLAAHKLHIPVVPRAEMLAELMRFRYGIAIAGTHGKTTTTSLVSSIFADAGRDPTFVIGGRLNSAGTNAQLGTGYYLIAEADESDASFLYLQPMVAVVTNIDRDHMGTYADDFSRLTQTFIDFLHRVPFYGVVILCIDDPVVESIVSNIHRPRITYGFNPDADIHVVEYEQTQAQSHFKAVYPKLGKTYEFTLNLPGKHNVRNALAAIAVAEGEGISSENMKTVFANFAGVGRRFQMTQGIRTQAGQAMLIDDYGHHPAEMRATLQAIRAGWPERRVVMVFQPHRYTRTHDLFEDFAAILSESDVVILLEVYSAGEPPIPGIDSRALCRAIRARSQRDPIFAEKTGSVFELINNVAQDNDIIVMQGAGNIGQLAAQLAKDKSVVV